MSDTLGDRPSPDEAARSDDRRGFLASASSWFMLGGLAAGYGTCGLMGLRYLFPSAAAGKAWLFVARVDELRPGESFPFRAPSGQRIAIARQGASGTVEDFVALSSTCPHLGCQVHWEAQNQRFFCPCHNGVFDPSGSPVSGPPADADQPLPRFPLLVREGSLFIEIPTASPGAVAAQPPRPGHDPCLRPRRPGGEPA